MAIKSDYYYWHMGMYMGRILSNAYIVFDWAINFEVLQPYWNLAYRNYFDAETLWINQTASTNENDGIDPTVPNTNNTSTDTTGDQTGIDESTGDSTSEQIDFDNIF